MDFVFIWVKVIKFWLRLSLIPLLGAIILIFTYVPELYGMIEKYIRELNNLHRFKTEYIVSWICIDRRLYCKTVNMKIYLEFYCVIFQE